MSDAKLTLKTNVDHEVELLYDTPKVGEGKYGTWWLYKVLHEGEEKALFPTGHLHAKLEHYRKGDQLIIQKLENDEGGIQWNVIPQEGTEVRRDRGGSAGTKGVPPNKTVPQPQQAVDWDLKDAKKTYDIHKQVCLKLAVGLEGEKVDFNRVEKNMDKLFAILNNRFDRAQTYLKSAKTLTDLKNIWRLYQPVWADEFEEFDFELLEKAKDDMIATFDVPF